LVIDNNWAAAKGWGERRRVALDLIERAERASRPVVVMTTSPVAVGVEQSAVPEPSGPMPASRAREMVNALAPLPWRADPASAAEKLASLPLRNAHITWIADGVDKPGRPALLAVLQQMGDVIYLQPDATDTPVFLLPPSRSGAVVRTEVRRLGGTGELPIILSARGDQGELLGVATGTIPSATLAAEVEMTLPVEQANRLRTLSLNTDSGAAGVVLLGGGWRRQAVGIASQAGNDATELLSHPNYFLTRGLAPYADVDQAPIETLLDAEKTVLFLSGTLPGSAVLQDRLKDWVAEGGLLVRFAADGRLPEDELLPVRLRQGDRALGGALSWERPQQLAPFPEHGPFAGLSVPAEVFVSRQVLAEPGPDLADRSWASLADGTPLVTGAPYGQGMVVLFHVTADNSWSDLPLSGLYVEMLQGLMPLADAGGEVSDRGASPPAFTLDGFGVLGPAAVQTLPLPSDPIAAGPRHPPGLYGIGNDLRPLNLGPELATAELSWDRPAGISTGGFDTRTEQELAPWLLFAALILLFIDGIATLALRGELRVGRAALVLAGILVASPASAQDASSPAAALQTRLGYVITGDSRADRISALGLTELSRVISQRTSVELAAPDGVALDRDILALYPLLYWPLSDAQDAQGAFAMQRLRRYLDQGGTLLIDSRDRQVDPSQVRRLLDGLSVPPLQRLPDEHVLTRAFYLMRGLPGRFPDAPVWIEVTSEHDRDGVSPLIIGGNDWAGAWAKDAQGLALMQPIPGGEVQREQAYRFGVNLVMYALTGNYKSDQVHLPAILERLTP
jgi:hypothetical protein